MSANLQTTEKDNTIGTNKVLLSIDANLKAMNKNLSSIASSLEKISKKK
ncbi:MAG: hypothetical protein JKY89_03680 [Immundisolibacteraceae bacterium]|nr:hypothetical protein [Immundisolibacteraceae bacterium]